MGHSWLFHSLSAFRVESLTSEADALVAGGFESVPVAANGVKIIGQPVQDRVVVVEFSAGFAQIGRIWVHGVNVQYSSGVTVMVPDHASVRAPP